MSLIIGIIHYKMYIHKSMYSLFNLPTEEKEGELNALKTLGILTQQTFDVGITPSIVYLRKQRPRCKQIAQDFKQLESSIAHFNPDLLGSKIFLSFALLLPNLSLLHINK